MTDLYRSNDPDYDYEIRIKHVPLAIYDANTEEGRYKTVKHLLKDECKDVSVLVVDRVKGRSPVGINVDVHFTKVKCLN
ncbi:MAG: hypothetical protein GQ547_00415 [Methylophaga sp.]|nr:hypothetical protein [Methylophaga sp.]